MYYRQAFAKYCCLTTTFSENLANPDSYWGEKNAEGFYPKLSFLIYSTKN